MDTEKRLSEKLTKLRNDIQSLDPFATTRKAQLGREMNRVKRQLKNLSSQKDPFAMREES